MFPYDANIEIEKGFVVSYCDVLKYVWPLLTAERRLTIQRVASRRNFNISVVLENIYDRGNCSAVMRTQEAFGFGCVEIIEGLDRFKNANRVSSGAEKWLKLRRWRQTRECIEQLKVEGYRICVTSLQSSKPIGDIDWSRPTALVLGNEKEGASAEVLEMADDRVIVPMVGFVQSFNISVAGAVTLYHISQALSVSKGGERTALSEENVGSTRLLSNEQVDILKAHFALKTLDSASHILKAHLLKDR